MIHDPRFDPPPHPWEPEYETNMPSEPPEWARFVIMVGIPTLVAMILVYFLADRMNENYALLKELERLVEENNRRLRALRH